MFYLGVIILLVLALLFVVWPISVRQRASQAHRVEKDTRHSANIVLYRDHMDDLEQSLKACTIDNEQYQQLKAEMERNLLEDNQTPISHNSEQEQQHTVSYWVVAAVALVVVALSVGVYQHLGAYQSSQVKSVLEQRTELENRYIATGDKSLEAKITVINQQLTEKLAAHLDKQPDDLQMRVLLARTLMGLGDYPRAITQFQAVLERDPELSQIMAEMAQAVFLQANNRVVPIVQTLVDRTLQLDPKNTIALGLAGISAFHQQQYQQAIDFWQQAVAIQGANNPNAIALQSGIEAAKQRLASAPEAAAQDTPLAQERTQSATGSSTEGESKVVVAVSLADQVDFSPEDTVFIYARAWQGARMPLSIARIKASQLPLTLALTNEMSMAPGMNLGSAQELELVARLSKGGDPVPKSGDWQVTLGPVMLTDLASSPYSLVIADRIP